MLTTALGKVFCILALAPSTSQLQAQVISYGPAFPPDVPSAADGPVHYIYEFAGRVVHNLQCTDANWGAIYGKTTQWGTANGVLVRCNGDADYKFQGLQPICAPVYTNMRCHQTMNCMNSPTTYFPANSDSTDCPYEDGAFFNGLTAGQPATPVVTEHIDSPEKDGDGNPIWSLDYTHPTVVPPDFYFETVQCDCSETGLPTTAAQFGWGAYYKIEIWMKKGSPTPGTPALPPGGISGFPTPPGASPVVAVPDLYAIPASDSPVHKTFDVLVNDKFSSRSTVVLTILSAPAHGSVAVTSDKKVVYTSEAGFEGDVQFMYQISENGQPPSATTDTIRIRSFAAGTDGTIADVAVQDDGQILIAGNFTHVNSDHGCLRVARLDPSGGADDSFNQNAAGVIANEFFDVNCIAVDKLHRVYVGGDAMAEDGALFGRLIRLTPEGNLDHALNDQSDFVFDTDDWGTILTISGGGHEIWWDPANHQTDISVGGLFNSLAGVPNNNLADIMIGDVPAGDGAVDGTLLYPGIVPENWIYTTLRTAGGMIAGGDTRFTSGDFEIGNASYDGANYTSTFSGGADDAVYSLALQPDGKMIAGGRFSVLGYTPATAPYGSPHSYLGRFNADGSVDETFHPAADGIVNSVLVQTDGGILAGGVAGLQRFNAIGHADSSVNFGINGTVNKLIQQSDGSVIAVGSFSSAGGQPHANIVRFGPEASGYSASFIQSFANLAGNPNPLVWNGVASASSFSFRASGPPGSTWQVEATSDWINWTQVGTVTIPLQNDSQNDLPFVLPGTITSFTDHSIANVPQRFYFLVRQAGGTYHYSQAIGFMKVTAGSGSTLWSKYTAVANQLDAYPNNSLASVFDQTAVPAGTTLEKDNIVYNWDGTSWSGTTTFAPGEGGMLLNNSGSPFTMTFVGTVREGHLVKTIAGNHLSSSLVPQAGPITSRLNYQPISGDVVYRWDPLRPGWYLAGIYFNAADAEDQTGIYNTAGWYDGNMEPTTEPSVNIGEAFTLQAGGWFYPGSNDWIRDFSVFQQFHCTPPPSGLVSWWRAEGDGVDSMGGNNGTFVGEAGFASGEAGQAFSINANNSGVDVGNPASLQLQNFTIEGWIKRGSPTSSTWDYYGCGAIFHCAWGGYGLGILDNGQIYLTKIGYSSVSSTGTITDTNWHHVAVTKNGSTVVLYIDGVGETTAPYDPGFIFSNGTMAIGTRGQDYVADFRGAIDELSIYNRALSAAEVQSVFNVGSIGKCH